MLTTTEVANFLCLHPNTVRKWADRGLLRAVRLGPRRDRRFPPEEILRIIRENSERNQTTG
ncbi:MAG: DNA-binding protein [Chloroflexi bacterium]|nr:MAG: DNA-binding protein [Chloroflexota bacterium]